MKSDPDEKKISLVKAVSWAVGGAGAIGTGLQNFMALFSFLNELGKMSQAVTQGLAIAFGGAVSGIVNLWMNIDLLEAFLKRLTGEKPKPELNGWKKFRYYAVSLVFITTGILFGMTAFAFGGTGVLASLGMAAGILVAAIMMIQELETWLQSFDQENTQTSLKMALINWWKKLSPARATGFVISVGNVLALSLLFALGLTSFLTMTGVPLFPAIVAGLVVSFTAGAFTEFYFYNFFLAEFCDKVVDKWKDFLKLSPAKMVLGVFSITSNAVVNSILCYAGLMLFNTLLATSGMNLVPMAVIITAAAFCGLASFILGSDFWIKVLAPKTASYSAIPSGDDEAATPALTISTKPTTAHISVTKPVLKQSTCFLPFWKKSTDTNELTTEGKNSKPAALKFKGH